MLSLSYGQVTHALLARPPLSFNEFIPKESFIKFSFDLHVLGTPPAFVLSQDQTLEYNLFLCSSEHLMLISFADFSSAFPNFLFVKNSSNCFTLSGSYKNSHCSFFNVQNIFSCRPSRNNSFIIAHFVELVNTFFKTFSKIFIRL